MKRKLLVLLMAAAMLATVLPERAVTIAMGEDEVPNVTEESGALTEETEPEAEETPAEEPETPFKATVRVKLEKDGDIYYGDRVTLVAKVKANGEYTVSWEYLDEEPEEPVWVAVGKGETYAFNVTVENAVRTYRAVVNGVVASAEFKLPSIKEVVEEVEPEVTEEPAEEAEPEVTEEPAEEVEPEVTEEPAEETEPEVTEEPAEETEPEVTEEPAEEIEPEVTEEPAEEAEPEVTEEPAEEAEPEVTEEPAEEVEPEVTEEPAEEVEPEVTEEPVEEVEPEVTEEPAEEVEPEVTEEPAEEAEPEVTEEPLEEVEPEVMEEPAEEPAAEPMAELNPDRDIQIRAEWDGDLYYGDTVTLVAELVGYENAVYTVQWQTSEDGENWTDVEDATELTYAFAVTEENCLNCWRLTVNVTGVLVEE